MKVVFYGSLIHHLPPTLIAKVKTPWTIERFLEKDAKEDFARALADADVLISMVWNGDFPPAPRLKLIQSPGTGVDFIDFAAVPRGVRVCNCYGHAEGTAEYVMLALLLWCQTSFVPADASFRHERSWRYSGRVNGPIMGELYGKTVGIVGLGSIGRRVAELLSPFGVRLLATAWRADDGRAAALGARAVPIDQLLMESDVVTLHLRVTPETTGFLSKERLASMKPTAVLVNTSRGALVDSAALVQALRSGRLAGAALDVFIGGLAKDISGKDQPCLHPVSLQEAGQLVAHKRCIVTHQKRQGKPRGGSFWMPGRQHKEFGVRLQPLIEIGEILLATPDEFRQLL